MGDWAMIGVPSSAGAHHAGQERAPDALRATGLAGRLAAAGESVQDLGNLPEAPFAPTRRARRRGPWRPPRPADRSWSTSTST
jgi:arginase